MFVVISIIIPLYVEYSYEEVKPEAEVSLVERAGVQRSQEPQATWQDLTFVFWGIAIVGLYLAHLIMAGSAFRWNSTPFTYLFAPLLFAMITYYRLFWLSENSEGGYIVSGHPGEIAGWVVGVLAITFLVARVRMARYRLQFRDVDWDIVTPTKMDRTYFELCANFTPLVYPPRIFRACSRGILVEGWLYLMPLPMEVIQSVEAAKRATYMTSGHYLATSSKSLLRVQLVDYQLPIMISPSDRKELLEYMEKKLAPKHGGTWAGATRSGAEETRGGLRAHRQKKATGGKPVTLRRSSGSPKARRPEPESE
jgi:hypothetical protein